MSREPYIAVPDAYAALGPSLVTGSLILLELMRYPSSMRGSESGSNALQPRAVDIWRADSEDY